MPSPPQLFEFGAFQLNVHEQRLLRDGRPVALPPKAFEVLVALVERSGQLVTREALLRRGWPDTFVTAGSLSYTISLIRKALAERPGRRTFIETVPKRGYRFVASRVIVPAEPLMSVVVLPLAWEATDTDGEQVADGLTEGLIDTLSRHPHVRVIACVTAFTYKGRAVDIRRIADDLGVSAVLIGRICRRGDTTVVHVEIVEPLSMTQVWGDSFRHPASELPAALDAIASAVVEQLASASRNAEPLPRSRLRSTAADLRR